MLKWSTQLINWSILLSETKENKGGWDEEGSQQKKQRWIWEGKGWVPWL